MTDRKLFGCPLFLGVVSFYGWMQRQFSPESALSTTVFNVIMSTSR